MTLRTVTVVTTPATESGRRAIVTTPAAESGGRRNQREPFSRKAAAGHWKPATSTSHPWTTTAPPTPGRDRRRGRSTSRSRSRSSSRGPSRSVSRSRSRSHSHSRSPSRTRSWRRSTAGWQSVPEGGSSTVASVDRRELSVTRHRNAAEEHSTQRQRPAAQGNKHRTRHGHGHKSGRSRSQGRRRSPPRLEDVADRVSTAGASTVLEMEHVVATALDNLKRADELSRRKMRIKKVRCLRCHFVCDGTGEE